MLAARPGSARKRVLIIEPHALFAPYFATAIAAGGHDVVGVETAARPSVLRRLAPEIVVLNAGYFTSVGRIRTLRSLLPDARLVVYTRVGDPAWSLLALAVGADAVIGPRADEPELLAALAATSY